VSRELRVGVEPAALSNVEVNRLRGANELVTESRAIAMTEPSNERIDAIYTETASFQTSSFL